MFFPNWSDVEQSQLKSDAVQSKLQSKYSDLCKIQISGLWESAFQACTQLMWYPTPRKAQQWLILRLKRCDHHQSKFQTETWRDALTSKFHLNETFWGRHSQPAVLNQDYFSSNCILAKDLAPWGWVCPGSLNHSSCLESLYIESRWWVQKV